MPDEQNHWEDNGLNWTAVGALRLAPQTLAVEAVRKAVVERCAASGAAVPAIFSSRAGAFQPTAAFLRALHETVSGLIPRFVEHHDHGGDWTALPDPSQVAPLWTEARLLARLAAVRLPCPDCLAPLTTEWLLQQRQLLNELLWVKKPSVINPFANPARLKRLSGSAGELYLHGYSFPETLAYCARGENPPIELFLPYAAANWDSQGWYDAWMNSAMAWEEAFMDGVIFACRLERCAKTYKLEFSWPRGAIPVEHYAYLRRYQSYNCAFDASEIGYAAEWENMVVKTFSGAVELNGSATLATVGALESKPFWPPGATGVTIPQPSGDITNYSGASWELACLPDLGYHDCVLKFDGANGFAFV